MNPPKVTVVLGSCRPGGVDISLSALARQTYDNFEVLFVDGRYRKRHSQVMAFAAHVGLSQKVFFSHVPNHRNQPEGSLWTTPGAGYNTGIMLAAGAIVVFMMDYSVPGPDWLSAHVRAHDEGPSGGRLVMGPYRYRKAPIEALLLGPLAGHGFPAFVFEPGARETTGVNIVMQRERFDEIAAFSGLLPVVPNLPDAGGHRLFGPGPLDVTWCHTKNESFPREAALAINGFPEWYDRVCGPGDLDFGHQLGQAGVEGWCPGPDANLDAVDMRWVLTNGSIVVPRSEFSTDPMAIDRPYYDLGDAFYQRRKSVVGRVNNHYSLRDKSLTIWDWREWGASEETSIPDTAMADADYFPEWHTEVVERISRGEPVTL